MAWMGLEYSGDFFGEPEDLMTEAERDAWWGEGSDETPEDFRSPEELDQEIKELEQEIRVYEEELKREREEETRRRLARLLNRPAAQPDDMEIPF